MFNEGYFEHIHKYHESLGDDFQKLFLDSSVNIPIVGDRVVVAAGLIGRGHNWIRKEAAVIEVGETSVHVKFKEDKDDRTFWIHPALITDVLTRE